MRKLVVCNILSLDGFYSGPNADVMVMPFDRGFDEYNAERFRTADTLLLGRKSYELFRSFWPAVADDVNQPPIEREVSRFFAAIEKLVVSGTLNPEDVEGWGSTRIVRPASVHDAAEARRSPATRSHGTWYITSSRRWPWLAGRSCPSAPQPWRSPGWHISGSTASWAMASSTPPRSGIHTWPTSRPARSGCRRLTDTAADERLGGHHERGMHRALQCPKYRPYGGSLAPRRRRQAAIRIGISFFDRWATRMGRGGLSGRLRLARRTLARWIGMPVRTDCLVNQE